DEIAAADGPSAAGVLLAEELAVHHRHAPVAPAADELRRLEAVAEVAEVAAERNARLTFHAAEHGGGGAGEDALADPRLDALREILLRHAEEQHRHARAAVRRFLGSERALDAGLEAAADHRGGEARHRHR